MQKGFAVLVFILIIGLLSVGIIGGAYYYKSFIMRDQGNSPLNTSTKQKVPSDEQKYTNWKLYSNKFYQFQYPANIVHILENKNSDQIFSSISIVITKVDPNQEFVHSPITVTVTSLDKKMDVTRPKTLFGYGGVGYDINSLENKQVQEIILDNNKAFSIKDIPVGLSGVDQEIVSVKNGFLYDISVYCCFDNIQGYKKEITEQIISSFKFII